MLPSTLEDHHEPDSGTVQSRKELSRLSKLGWPWDSVNNESESVLLVTDKQLKNLVVIVNTRPGQKPKGCRVNRVKEFPCSTNRNLEKDYKMTKRYKKTGSLDTLCHVQDLETPLRAKFYSEPRKVVQFWQPHVAPVSSLIAQAFQSVNAGNLTMIPVVFSFPKE